MKKLIGMLAIATVFSGVMMGCQPPAEGDTAPAPDAGKAAPETKTPAPDAKTTG
jgi:hypothetical protein